MTSELERLYALARAGDEWIEFTPMGGTTRSLLARRGIDRALALAREMYASGRIGFADFDQAIDAILALT